MRLLFALLLATPLLFPGEVAIDSTSRMWIDGTSSIHAWTCDVPTVEGTISMSSPNDVTAAHVSVPIGDIECHKGKMNSKMRKALKSKTHPRIEFRLDFAEARQVNGGTYITARGPATIAGAQRTIEMELEMIGSSDMTRFTSTVPLKMSDFGVDPPTALLGTLKTGDDIVIRFDVAVRNN